MKLRVGEEFKSLEAELEAHEELAPVIEAVAHAQLGSARKNVVWFLMAVAGVFLVGAALIGLWDGSFDELGQVWLCVGPVAGVIVGHYFPAVGDGNGKGS